MCDGIFLVGLAAALALGVVFEWNFLIAISTLAAIFAAIFAVGIGLAIRKNKGAYLCLCISFFLLGAMRLFEGVNLPESDISNLSGKDCKVAGVVKDAPRITEKADGEKRLRLTLEVNKVGNYKDMQKATGTVYFYAPYNGEAVNIGDTVEAFGSIRRIRPAGNPGAYDRRTHLLSEGITAEVFGGKSGLEIIKGEEYPILRKAAEIRSHYKESMEKVMPKQDAAAIFAMLFGGYEGLREELTEAFTRTGIVHILSVSGSHVSMLAAVVAILGGIFRIPKIPLAIILFFTIAFYTLLAGFVPPALRAAVMGSLVFMGTALSRDVDSKRLLTLTGIGFLLVNPLLLFHISFQLSFTATAGIICFGKRLSMFFESKGLKYVFASSLALTLSAQVLTIPVIAWYFHRLPISSVAANFLIVPPVELIIIIGLFSGIVAFITPFLGNAIFFFDSLLLGAVYEAARLLAKIPPLYLPTMGFLISGIYYLFFMYFMPDDNIREKIKPVFAKYRGNLAILLISFAVAGLIVNAFKPKEAMFAFIDVGQGDAMVVKTPKGRAFMFDAGGNRDGNFDVGARVDVPFLLYHGITELEYIFLSHVHEDHAAGTGGILKSMPVKEVVTAAEGKEAYQKSMKVSAKIMERTRFSEPSAGDVYNIDGVVVEVLYAPKTAKGENEMSNLYRVSYGAASFLITGDLVKEDEIKLVEKGVDLTATVLKVGHHGSKTSSDEAFLKKVAPKYAVISVGEDNPFGHPDDETLKKLKTVGAKIYRTDKDGAVFFYTDGKKLRVKNYLYSGRQ